VVDLDDVLWEDGLAQAALVRAGEVTARELVEGTIERIERVDPLLNAVVTPLFAQALQAAEAGDLADTPFAGVPMLLKDHLATYGGARHTSGSIFLRNNIAKRDSELVTRFKRAGMIPVGVTNTCELALLSTTEPALHGATLNPWNLARSTGGSSGGSAAAVAAGLVPFAHGNDSAGSLRIPASCCGVFGLKPSRGRVSPTPRGDLAPGIWSEHVMTRSVRDCAAVLDSTAGTLPHDQYSRPRPAGPFQGRVGADPGRLRIAVSDRPLQGGEVHDDCVRAVWQTAELCAELGHEIVEAAPIVDGAALEADFFALYTVAASARIAEWVELMGREPDPAELEPLTWAVREAGQRHTAVEHVLAVQRLQRATRDIVAFFDDVDLWLTPTLAEPPAPLGYFDPSPLDPLATLDLDARFSPFTWIANVTGQPAMSVPLAWNDEGLPIGSHFLARLGGERVLFALAGQLEQARPWAHRRPPISVGSPAATAASNC
jgi:amidase